MFFQACLIYFLLAVPFSSQESHSIRVERVGDETERGFQLDLLVSQKDQMKLTLSKSSHVSPKAPVFVSSSAGSFVKLNTSTDNEFAVYQDAASNAAFLRFPDSSIQGTFRYANKEFFISPNRKKGRRKREVSVDYVANSVDFDTLTKVPDRPPKHYIKLTDEMKAYLTDASADKLHYVVEVILFIDFSIYKNWLSLVSDQQGGREERSAEAINSIRYYYSSVVNAMDLRYNNIKEDDFSISIKLAGFVIGTTDASSSWTHNYLVREGGVAVDSYKVLDDFPTWLDSNSHLLPEFDNALIFTRLPLRAGNYDDGKPRYITGLANIGAVCTNQAISINKENALFASTGTASHELAHNLGSLHDVSSENNCRATDQYIMSPAPGQLTTTTALNPFKFSPCSIDYMRQYLGALSLMKKNCLFQTSYNPSLKGVPLDKPVGQFLDINRQCMYLFGSESFYCAGMNFDLKMCTSLLCYDPVSRRCTTRIEYRAANGTSCGNRKWCYKGNCIHNKDAPFASDFCLSGDYRGPDFNCKIEIPKDPSRCYDEHYGKKCCAMCHFMQRSSTSCIYGDKMPEYCSTISASQCYNDDIRSKCCDTCSQLRTSTYPGCEYGDKAEWCANTQPSMCYRDFKTCCAFCLKNQDYRAAGCEYGDKAEWCSSITREQCTKVSEDCCKQCSSGATGASNREKPNYDLPSQGEIDFCPGETKWCKRLPPFACYEASVTRVCPCACNIMKMSTAKGCEFGDKEAWCKMVAKEDCSRVKNPADCCFSCSGSLISSANKESPFVFGVEFYVAIIYILFPSYHCCSY